MQPANIPPSSPQLNPDRQELPDQSTEKPEKAKSSWFGSVVTRLLHAIGYVKTGTGPDTALADRLADRKVSSPDPDCPADTGTQSETSLTTDPQLAIEMEPEEVLPALDEAVKEKDADRVQSLLASLKLSSPDQAAQTVGNILKTVLQDNLPSIRSLPPEEYNKLKALIDCLLAGCDHDDSTLANSALELFFDRKDFDHAAHIKETCKATANLEADRLKTALDELVQDYAPYAEPTKALETVLQKCTSDHERTKALDKLIREYGPDTKPNKSGELSLYDHGKAILHLVNLQDSQSLEFAGNTLADGLAKCLEDSEWLRKLDETKYQDIVNFFTEFFKHGIKSEKLAYSLMNLCFTRLNYDRADSIAKEYNVCLTDEHLIAALKNPSHQSSVDRLLNLATPEAAGKQVIKDTVQEILNNRKNIVWVFKPHEIPAFEGFIASYAWHLPGEVSDKLFLLNPLIEFCVRGKRIDLAQMLKIRFEGCYLEQQAYRDAVQKVTLSSMDETEKSMRLKELSDLARHTMSKTD